MRRRVRRTVILVAAVLAVIGITAFYGYYWVVSDFADMPAGVAPSPPGQIVPPPTATLPAPTLPPPTAHLPKPKPPPKGNGGGPETGKGGTETGNGGTALTPPSPTPTLPSPGLPDYPWPPEEPSSLVRIDSLYPDDWHERSLFEVAELLTAALQEAAYLELGFYAAPGGFVMVTRLEGTDAAGAPLAAERRYQLSDDRSDFSFREYVLSLFFAPKGYYRFIAFVVSDVPYTTRDEPLEEMKALERLHRGGVALPREYADLPFSPYHRVDALIYEFRKGGHDGDVETLRPGRLPPNTHLENSGISLALASTLQSP